METMILAPRGRIFCGVAHADRLGRPVMRQSITSLARWARLPAALWASSCGSSSPNSRSFCGSALPPALQDKVSFLDSAVAPFLTEEVTKLHKAFGTPDDKLVKEQVDSYYTPLFAYLKLMMDLHCEKGTNAPLMIGLSAPQGCGKVHSLPYQTQLIPSF